MREPKEVERLAASPTLLLALCGRGATELQQASLVGVQREAQLLRSVPQCFQERTSVGFGLESEYEVIGVANHDARTFAVGAGAGGKLGFRSSEC